MFEDRAYDFGTIPQGQDVHHVFRFTNAGQEPVAIQGIHSACGCTAATSEIGKVYPPGSQGEIAVTFQSAGFLGPITKLITVVTSEQLLPNHTLTLRGTVAATLALSPSVVNFGTVTTGQSAVTRTVTARLAKSDVGAISDVKTDHPAITATLVPDTQDSWRIDVTLSPGEREPQDIRGSVRLVSSNPLLASMTLPVRAMIEGPVRADAKYLEFGALSPGEAASRPLVLRGDRPISVGKPRVELHINGARVEDPAPYMVLEPEKQTASDEHRLEARLVRGGGPTGSVHGRLYIQAEGNDLSQEVIVDFYALFL